MLFEALGSTTNVTPFLLLAKDVNIAKGVAVGLKITIDPNAFLLKLTASVLENADVSLWFADIQKV